MHYPLNKFCFFCFFFYTSLYFSFFLPYGGGREWERWGQGGEKSEGWGGVKIANGWFVLIPPPTPPLFTTLLTGYYYYYTLNIFFEKKKQKLKTLPFSLSCLRPPSPPPQGVRLRMHEYLFMFLNFFEMRIMLFWFFGLLSSSWLLFLQCSKMCADS